jgi:hypothetical protein
MVSPFRFSHLNAGTLSPPSARLKAKLPGGCVGLWSADGKVNLLARRRRSTNGILIAAAALTALWLTVPEARGFGAPEASGCSVRAKSGERVYTGQRITLDFKDAEIVNVLRILSEIGGENLVITDDVKGRITLRLVDVPWDQAFDVVLQTNGLECIDIGSVRRVSTLRGSRQGLPRPG